MTSLIFRYVPTGHTPLGHESFRKDVLRAARRYSTSSNVNPAVIQRLPAKCLAVQQHEILPDQLVQCAASALIPVTSATASLLILTSIFYPAEAMASTTSYCASGHAAPHCLQVSERSTQARFFPSLIQEAPPIASNSHMSEAVDARFFEGISTFNASMTLSDEALQTEPSSSPPQSSAAIPSASPSTVQDPRCLDDFSSGSATASIVEPETASDQTEVSDLSVVLEAWDVVNEAFLDARGKGWDPSAWEARKEAVLRRPPHSRPEAYAMISSMLASLNDPYSRFVAPKQFSYLSKYDITGIGLNIGEEVEGGEARVKVVGIILGSPAQVAGVRQGDELVSVDGVDVTGMTPFDVASLIQGPRGSEVTVAVRHGACAPVQSFTLTRESDVKSPVFYRAERRRASLSPFSSQGDEEESSGNSSTSSGSRVVGYIKVKEFNAVAKRDVATAVQRLEAAGASSFVLDLQDNPGGLVQAGVEISKLFLDRGDTVVYTEARGPSSQRSIEATGAPLTRAPLTVLVNGRTASASEIVAAALRDNCRALLVGSRTFGKGLIQTVYELNDGSGLILTVGKYVTPAHMDIDTNGIQPDFKRPPSDELRQWKLETCKKQREELAASF